MILSNNILNKHIGPETKTQFSFLQSDSIAINENISELHTIYEVKDMWDTLLTGYWFGMTSFDSEALVDKCEEGINLQPILSFL